MIISKLVAEGLQLTLYDDETLQGEAVRMEIKPDAIKDTGSKFNETERVERNRGSKSYPLKGSRAERVFSVCIPYGLERTVTV